MLFKLVSPPCAVMAPQYRSSGASPTMLQSFALADPSHRQIARISGIIGLVVIVTGAVIQAGVILNGLNASLPPLRWLDINAEQSLPAWYSSTLLAACALLTGRSAQVSAGHLRAYWWVATGLLLFMSADESISIHEYAIWVVAPDLSLPGFLAHEWVLAGAAVAALVGVLMLPMLRLLPGRTAFGLLAAGSIYLLGAIGMELIGAKFMDDDAVWQFAMPVPEEGLEILGLNTLLVTLLRHSEGDALLRA
jgi:hypothetical protein